MKKIVGLWTCLIVATVVVGQAGVIPDTLHSPDRERPVWVRADRALTPDGTIDPELFDEGERRVIQGFLALPQTGGCIRLGVTRPDEKLAIAGEPEPTDLQSAVRAADWVVVAKVTARAGGFHGSLPGTLLELQPTEVFKGPQGRSWAQHVFMPVGTVVLGESTLCKSDPQRAALPEIGDEALLLADLSARDRLGLLPTDAAAITVLSRDGRVSLPHLLRGGARAKRPMTREELLSIVRLAAGEGR